MKKIGLLLFAILSIFTLSSCQNNTDYPDVVTTMFIQYDITKTIVGDHLDVELIVPFGEGVHGFEPSSQDMILIENAKLFLFTSTLIDAWIQDPNTIGGDDTIVVDMSESLHADDLSNHTSILADDHDHDIDAHYWVSPENSIHMVEHILEVLIEIDPEHESIYQDNADQFIESIESKALAFKAYIDNLETVPTLYIAGHSAFDLFGDYFGINMISIFGEFEPDADLTSLELATFTEAVLDAQTHYIFADALEAPYAANAVISELQSRHDYNLTLLKLSAYQNMIQSDYEAGITYLDLMDRNFNAIKEALGV